VLSHSSTRQRIENTDRTLLRYYGGKSLHEQSHGESFISLAQHRFGDHGLYPLDEPEAALSPARQLLFLKVMNRLVDGISSQFVVATHSPILLAYPDALIYQFGEKGLREIAYEDTEHFQVTRDFLSSRERYFKHLFADVEAPGDEEDE
jgi:predicted ATPase